MGTRPRHGPLLAGNVASWRAQARGARVAACLLLGLLAACDGDEDSLRATQRIALPDSAIASVHPFEAGFWLATPTRVYRVAGDSVRVYPTATPLERAPDVIGFREGDPILATGRSLLRVDGDSIVAFGTPDQATAAASDPRGRYLFRATDMGTIVVHDAATLAPMLGWGAVGAPAEALAISPEGDRVYQPAAATEYREDSEILVRDLQTGRILRRVQTPTTVRRLESAPDGSLFGVMWDDEGDGDVFAARWVDGELGVDWRTSLASLDLAPPIRLVLAHDGSRLALLGMGSEETGLRLLDAETGLTIGWTAAEGLDLAFDSAGRLFLLVPGELRRIE